MAALKTWVLHSNVTGDGLCRTVQPVVAAWNPSGYLFNAIDRIGLIVEGV